MNAWMNSAGHKANILKKAYREVGIGIRLGVPTDDGVGATDHGRLRRQALSAASPRLGVRWPTSSPSTHFTTT